MRVRGRAWLHAPVVAGLVFLFAACARDDLPQNTLAPLGPEAQKIDRLFQPVFWIAVAVFVLVEGALVYALVRYRHKPGRGVPVQVHGNKRLEVLWTIVPAVLLAVLAVPTIGTVFDLASRPAGALDITVTGHQWWWEIEYPGMNVVTANEVHVPAGRPVFITLKSVDVIHSFWIPRLAGKQDLEPGHENHLRIEAPSTPPGQPVTYFGQCVEYCGLSHANMRLRLVAQAPADFDEWVQQQLQPAAQPPADVLAAMTRVSCNGCHTISGLEGFAGTVGPSLTHFADRSTFAGAMFDRTSANLAKWLSDAPGMKPGADMPRFAGQLTPAEIDALVQYLESLK